MATEILRGGKGLSGPTFDGSGRLHCVGSGDGKIYSEDGGMLVEIGDTGGVPCALVFDHLGTLYVTDTAHGAVLLVKDDGTQRVVVSEYEGKPLKGPHSAAIDSAGNLYFTDSGPFGETSLLDPSGSVFVVTGEANNRILRPLALERLAYPTGIAMGPKESAVFVAEMSANRILRFSQRPAGVWHATVFHQFSGRMGPSALAWDEARGYLYAARFEFPDLATAAGAGAGGGAGAPSGVVSVLTAEGVLLRDVPIPGAPEVTGVALTPEGTHLVVTCSDAVYKIQL